MVVGSWNADEHIEWAKKNVARSYQLKDDGVQKVKYAICILLTITCDANSDYCWVFSLFIYPVCHHRLVSHFYGHGDLCDLTGKPRQVIVKLKWVSCWAVGWRREHGTWHQFSVTVLRQNMSMTIPQYSTVDSLISFLFSVSDVRSLSLPTLSLSICWSLRLVSTSLG